MAQQQLVSSADISGQITQLKQAKTLATLSPILLGGIFSKIKTSLDATDLRFRSLASNQAGNPLQLTIEGIHVKNLTADQITTGTLVVGGGAGDPQLSVVNASGVEVGWIGVRGVYSGGWFSSLYVGGTGPADAVITANSGAVSINGATFTLNLNGTTTTIANTAFGSGFAGLIIRNNSTGVQRVLTPQAESSQNAAGKDAVVISFDGTNTVGKIAVCNGTGTGGIDGNGMLINLNGSNGRITARGDLLIDNGTAAQDLIFQPSALAGAAGALAGYITFKSGGTDYKFPAYAV